MTDDKDPAHESDMRRLTREQLRHDIDPSDAGVFALDDAESVPCEPWPLNELEF